MANFHEQKEIINSEIFAMQNNIKNKEFAFLKNSQKN